MPVHVEKMTNRVNVVDGELPLSEAQVEKLVKIILRRLEQREREAESAREATVVRPRAAPPA
jgi:hypothetical protein